YNGFSQSEWFETFFEGNIRAGSAGSMFWIVTPDPRRGYGVTYTTDRDREIFSRITHAAQTVDSLASAKPPDPLLDVSRHLIPRQFAGTKSFADLETVPQMIVRDDKSILYQFKPGMASGERFEKVGSGPGYIWGYGSGYLEYTVGESGDRRLVSEIVVRAHVQPVAPVDASRDFVKTRLTLFVNGWNCGSRLVPFEAGAQPIIQEWRMTGFLLRLQAMRGLPLKIRFAVNTQSDWLYGVNISNWPEGYDSKDARPVEVELRH